MFGLNFTIDEENDGVQENEPRGSQYCYYEPLARRSIPKHETQHNTTTHERAQRETN